MQELARIHFYSILMLSVLQAKPICSSREPQILTLDQEYIQ